MPPTRPLSTPCRYGYNCTRPDCFYTHPKGMHKERPKDEKQLCTFGRGCFKRVCLYEHPEGRLMDQMRANMDYCSTWMLVRTKELGRVSSAFQAAFPAPNDGKDRCDFVAAVPISVAFMDWKRYRGVSTTGTPDGVPGSPQNIQLFPRTRKGERLLQESENRAGMRWSPTPIRPWKTLERMATHDQHWEENQDMYVLCAGYEASPPASGVCIELSVTSVVTEEDGGDGQVAGLRVARDVLGLPAANSQKWFVFHISRPDESQEEAQFITVRTIVDTSKMPMGPQRLEPARAPPPPQPQATPMTMGAGPAAGVTPTAAFNAPPVGVASSSQHLQQQQQQQLDLQQQRQLHLQQQQGQLSTAPTSLASSYSPYTLSSSTFTSASPDGLGSGRFGSFRADETTKATSAPAPAIATTTPGAPGGATLTHLPPLQQAHMPSPLGIGSVAEQQQQQQQQQQPQQEPRQPQQPEYSEVDQLAQLLESLNMTKFRPQFDRKNVDFGSLKKMTLESEISSIGIPLGPRIKLMNELGIERS